MGILIGPGFWASTADTIATCPICEQKFDACNKIEKSKTPCFRMRCPHCKGKITVLAPVFSSDGVKVWETDCPPSVPRLETETGPNIEVLHQTLKP